MISGVYAFFQFIMPMLGWVLVTTLEEMFTKFSILIPWIALFLLLFIGGKMIVEAIIEKRKGNQQEKEKTKGYGQKRYYSVFTDYAGNGHCHKAGFPRTGYL